MARIIHYFGDHTSSQLRRIMCYSPNKGDRMLAYGILVNRRGNR